MSRALPAACLVRDQLDVFDPAGSITRATGITTSDLSITLFLNNVKVNWSLMDGSAVADSSISSGFIYFNPISGSNGFYSIRFFPDRVGFWRLVVRHATLEQEIIKEYDILAATSSASGGLNASFLRP